MINISRKSLILCAGLCLSIGHFLFPEGASANNFTLTYSQGKPNLSWTAAVDPSTPTADVTYIVYQKFGILNDPIAGGVKIQTTTLTQLDFGSSLIGSYCFQVEAYDFQGGFHTFDKSNIACHSFLHTPAAGSFNIIDRVDGSGSQLGNNQSWSLGYYLDTDAYISLKIFPPGTVFTQDVNTGFETTASNTPTSIMVDGLPRAGERGGFENFDWWYSRNSSGTTVSNGIYFAAFSAYLPSGTTQYADYFTIPVNIVRFTQFSTTGITPTVSLANIQYTINANSTVRIVIAKPGRQFVIDGSGNVQSLDATNTTIDTSTNSVVRVLTFNRAYGAHTETWDGTNAAGVAVSTGLYSVGVSALDGYGNQALNLTGNNGPVEGTIPVDRTPSLTSGNTTPPTINSVNVITLAGSTAINQVTGGTSVTSFTSIKLTLNVAAGSGNFTLTDPKGATVPGTISVSGTDITFSTTAIISATGTYVLAGSVTDTSANVTNINYNFKVAAGVSGGTAAGVTLDRVIPFPNPIKTAPASISFTLGSPSTVDIDIYTLTGQRVLHNSQSYPATTTTATSAATCTNANTCFRWALVNDAGNSIANGVYLLRIKATSATGSSTVTKKILVVK